MYEVKFIKNENQTPRNKTSSKPELVIFLTNYMCNQTNYLSFAFLAKFPFVYACVLLSLVGTLPSLPVLPSRRRLSCFYKPLAWVSFQR